MNKMLPATRLTGKLRELNPVFPCFLMYVVTAAQNLAITSCGHSTCGVLVSSWAACAHSVHKP